MQLWHSCSPDLHNARGTALIGQLTVDSALFRQLHLDV